MENLSQLVRRRRDELGINNAELARRAKKSRGYIGNIINETAPTKSSQYRITPETVRDLATALKIPEDDILAAIGYKIVNESVEEYEVAPGIELRIENKNLNKAEKQKLIESMQMLAKGALAK